MKTFGGGNICFKLLQKRCNSEGESQNPLAGTLGTTLSALLSSLLPWAGCFPSSGFGLCQDWYEMFLTSVSPHL